MSQLVQRFLFDTVKKRSAVICCATSLQLGIGFPAECVSEEILYFHNVEHNCWAVAKRFLIDGGLARGVHRLSSSLQATRIRLLTQVIHLTWILREQQCDMHGHHRYTRTLVRRRWARGLLYSVYFTRERGKQKYFTRTSIYFLSAVAYIERMKINQG